MPSFSHLLVALLTGMAFAPLATSWGWPPSEIFLDLVEALDDVPLSIWWVLGAFIVWAVPEFWAFLAILVAVPANLVRAVTALSDSLAALAAILHALVAALFSAVAEWYSALAAAVSTSFCSGSRHVAASALAILEAEVQAHGSPRDLANHLTRRAQEIAALRGELDTACAHQANLRKEVTALHQQIDGANGYEVAGLKGELRSKAAELTDLKALIRHQLSVLEQNRTTASEATDSVSRLSRREKKLQAELAAVRKDLDRERGERMDERAEAALKSNQFEHLLELIHRMADSPGPDLAAAVLVTKAMVEAGLDVATYGIDAQRADVLYDFAMRGQGPDLAIQPRGGFRFTGRHFPLSGAVVRGSTFFPGRPAPFADLPSAYPLLAQQQQQQQYQQQQQPQQHQQQQQQYLPAPAGFFPGPGQPTTFSAPAGQLPLPAAPQLPLPAFAPAGQLSLPVFSPAGQLPLPAAPPLVLAAAPPPAPVALPPAVVLPPAVLPPPATVARSAPATTLPRAGGASAASRAAPPRRGGARPSGRMAAILASLGEGAAPAAPATPPPSASVGGASAPTPAPPSQPGQGQTMSLGFQPSRKPGTFLKR
ncbi:hypothetical protein BDV95DRAFT_600610 [Massariosphaeria phaeospora]|uniref:Uncharacterized protein n=1 Tax=Massariosphaeria phaeospora TaxID=100035 RepID=A0A7C8MJL9_9PLEO|nr:hypothetical protein BDV95DRAFT_600610 [Massariosphaeria phaeospora]